MRTQLTEDVTSIVIKHAFRPNSTGSVGIPQANAAIACAVSQVLERLGVMSVSRDLYTRELKTLLFL